MIGRDGAAHFFCRSQRYPKDESWGVDLPNLITEWPNLSCKNIIQPTWNVSSFLRPSTNMASTSNFIYTNHVYARNLKPPYHTYLLKALHEEFVDHSTWCDSY